MGSVRADLPGRRLTSHPSHSHLEMERCAPVGQNLPTVGAILLPMPLRNITMALSRTGRATSQRRRGDS